MAAVGGLGEVQGEGPVGEADGGLPLAVVESELDEGYGEGAVGGGAFDGDGVGETRVVGWGGCFGKASRCA